MTSSLDVQRQNVPSIQNSPSCFKWRSIADVNSPSKIKQTFDCREERKWGIFLLLLLQNSRLLAGRMHFAMMFDEIFVQYWFSIISNCWESEKKRKKRNEKFSSFSLYRSIPLSNEYERAVRMTKTSAFFPFTLSFFSVSLSSFIHFWTHWEGRKVHSSIVCSFLAVPLISS